MPEQIIISSSAVVYEQLSDLKPDERRIMEEANRAMQNAYAPYSEFKVGAAVLLFDGTIVLGNNQENGAYPSGLCAERVALFAAHSNFPDKKVRAIAIKASSDNLNVSEPVAPCGACRQVMVEYEQNQGEAIPVLFSGETGPIYRVEAVQNLLPFVFKGDFLKKS